MSFSLVVHVHFCELYTKRKKERRVEGRKTRRRETGRRKERKEEAQWKSFTRSYTRVHNGSGNVTWRQGVPEVGRTIRPPRGRGTLTTPGFPSCRTVQRTQWIPTSLLIQKPGVRTRRQGRGSSLGVSGSVAPSAYQKYDFEYIEAYL